MPPEAYIAVQPPSLGQNLRLFMGKIFSKDNIITVALVVVGVVIAAVFVTPLVRKFFPKAAASTTTPAA